MIKHSVSSADRTKAGTILTEAGTKTKKKLVQEILLL